MNPTMTSLDSWPSLFLLILIRISGLLCLAPCFPIHSLPWRGRWVIIGGLAVLLTMAHSHHGPPLPTTLATFSVAMAREAAIGLVIGFAVLMLFSSLQLAGQIVTQMTGLRMAEIYDANLDAQVPVFGRLLDLVATAAFLVAGGHRYIMTALLDTFETYPPGQTTIPVGNLPEVLTNAITHSLLIAIRLAAPLIAALMFSMLTLGLLSRVLPQLNILAIGLGFNSLALSAAVFFALGSLGWTFQHAATSMLEHTRTNWLSVFKDGDTNPQRGNNKRISSVPGQTQHAYRGPATMHSR